MLRNISDEKALLKKISELEVELKKARKSNKYGLAWEDKSEQIVEDCKRNVPILRLKEKKKGIDPVVTTDESKDENILIEGDNYHALSVLNYTHKGKVDVIYIDPPYNTGNNDFKYNDCYVDKEDAYRHSKWLSFMHVRVSLARELLKNTGVIFVSIDNNELAQLKLLLDKIFGIQNFIANITVVNNLKGRSDDKYIATTHENLLIYKKSNFETLGVKVPDEYIKEYKFKDERGLYRFLGLRKRGDNSLREDRPNLFYPIYFDKESGKLSLDKKDFKNPIEILPKLANGAEGNWRWGKETFKERINELSVSFVKKRNEYDVVQKDYLHNEENSLKRIKAKSFWFGSEFSSDAGTKALKEIIPDTDFNNPKPVALIEYCLEQSAKQDAVVLDFFAGSGTTGQAVLKMNNQDGGNRKFILCTNNENNICEDVTFERTKRLIKGYKNSKGEKVSGYSTSLRYYKTDLVDIEKLHHTPDQAKVKLTYQAGEMVGLRENTLKEVEKNDWWQIFEGHGKTTAIYFKEDKEKLQDLIDLLEKKKQPAVLYIFSWGKNEYKSEYSSANIRVEDIPEPILEVYKEINRL
ncbi:MAG: site-specific DNA-methyltransferase [Candidatus Paceibacterota bacterium]